MSTVRTLIPGPIPQDHIVVHWQSSASSLSPVAEAFIAERWADYLAQAAATKRTLFDGTIAQFLGAFLEDRVLHLHLAPSRYSRYLVSCIRDRAWFERHAPQDIIRGMGNAALVTAGSTAILGLRSQNVAIYAGLADLFGGILEQLGTPELCANSHGILDHLKKELAEELSLGPADLADQPTLLGIMEDPNLATPQLLWHWPAVRSLQDFQQQEIPTEEHQRLVFLPAHQDRLPPDHPPLTPMAALAWEAWRRVL